MSQINLPPPPPGKKWFNVFAYPSLQYICAVSGTSMDDIYDPRIGGDGNVIWQEAETQPTVIKIKFDEVVRLCEFDFYLKTSRDGIEDIVDMRWAADNAPVTREEIEAFTGKPWWLIESDIEDEYRALHGGN